MPFKVWQPSLRPLHQTVCDEDLTPLAIDQPRLTRLRAAAVLLPFIEREGGVMLLMTRRSDQLKEHGGQIAFPGGKCEETDLSLKHTALRETFEEIELEEKFINPLGFLRPCKTSSGFCVFPLIAQVRDGFSLCPDSNEVAEVFEVPLSFVMSGDNHHKKTVLWHGHKRSLYEIPYYNPEGRLYNIWGVSAQIILQLYDIHHKTVIE